MLSRIDNERELYVLDHGSGYSCLGFDVLQERTNGVVRWLNNNGVPHLYMPDAWRGTADAYGLYDAAMKAGANFSQRTGKQCDAELTPQLIGHEGKRVEVVDKYGDTRRFIVGKSCGWCPCHLEIARRNSTGGGAVTGAPFKSIRFIREKAAR